MTTKNTLGKKLIRGLEHDLQLVSEQLRLARLWSNLSMDQIAQRASCSIPTLSKVEKGDYFIEYDRAKNIINVVKKALFGWGKIASSLKIPQNEIS